MSAAGFRAAGSSLQQAQARAGSVGGAGSQAGCAASCGISWSMDTHLEAACGLVACASTSTDRRAGRAEVAAKARVWATHTACMMSSL